MQVEAIYDNGRIELSSTLRFAHNRFRVIVEVPESEIIVGPIVDEARLKPDYVLPPEVQALANQMSERLDRIRNAALPHDDQLSELTPKQLERIDAFAFREELRRERYK